MCTIRCGKQNAGCSAQLQKQAGLFGQGTEYFISGPARAPTLTDYFTPQNRNDETLNLKYDYFEFGKTSEKGKNHFTTTLTWRKTNQADPDKSMY